MGLLNPKQSHVNGRFAVAGDEPLSKKVIGIRLPVSVYELLEPMPATERTEWLRRVISAAAIAELQPKS